MIIYYSSTGNSKHIALKLHEALQGDIIDITRSEKPGIFHLKNEEPLFIVTFNCFWGISNYMETFIQKSKFHNVSKVIVIITTGGYLGGGDAYIERLFLEKGLPKPTVYSLVMGTNYSILHDVPSIKDRQEMVAKAHKKLDRIIQGKQKPYHSNWLVRKFIPHVRGEYKKYRITEPFNVNSSCIGCGLCQKRCPVHAIEMVDNKPVWTLSTCDNCLKCLHHCPVEAINYGNITQNRLRYSYEACFKKKV